MLRRIFPFILIASLMLACNTIIKPFPAPTSTGTHTPSSIPGTPGTPATPPPVSQAEAPFNIAWDDRSLFRQNLNGSAQSILEGLPGASIYHIALSFSDPPTRVSGVETVRYTNQESTTLTEVDFAVFSQILGGSIVINNLSLDDQPVTPTPQAGLMRISLPSPLPPGESIVIHMEFETSVPTLGGDYYYGVFGYNDGILSLAHAYPTILVYNEQGWNNQTPDLDGDPLFSDTSFYLVSVNAPADLVLVASGKQVDHSVVAGRQRVLFADGPARDFYVAASSKFVHRSETFGEVTINIFLPAGQDQIAPTVLRAAETAIEDFSRRYASYPYTEFDIVPIITSAGGVEFPGMTSLSEAVINDPGYLEIVLTHEIGHQWFYNMVGNSTQGQPWLDESMAQFVTWQYYRDEYGTQGDRGFREGLQQIWGTPNNNTIPIGLPVSDYSSEEYRAIIYGRGAFFIMALRDKMGQGIFDQFMNEYTHRYEWAIASTEGFKHVAEESCSCDLTKFFDEWVNP